MQDALGPGRAGPGDANVREQITFQLCAMFFGQADECGREEGRHGEVCPLLLVTVRLLACPS